MPRKARELSAIEVARLKRPGLHAAGGVAGLHLQIAETGAKSWVLRFTVPGAVDARGRAKRRDMGLGGYPDVTLAQARDKAREARARIDQGFDPIVVRKEAKSAMRASAAAAKTFAQCATAYIDAKSAEWRNPKHRQQWTNTLEQYAVPVIGNVLVRDVTLAHILSILEPIWTAKTETASRLRGRIESVLDWATVRGYRTGENPARWRGHLEALLPSPKKVARVTHHPALPIDQLPQFVARLRKETGIGARALEFGILTAARSGEVRGATWGEIDLRSGLWVVPADRMKAGKEHRVPLSPAAVSLLREMPRIEGIQHVFPSPRGRALSDMTLTAVMRRMGVNDAVPHGFRSTFRDWVAERTSYPRELAEKALAHTLSNEVEAAYQRSDMLAKRAELMIDWSKFCGYRVRARVDRKKAA